MAVLDLNADLGEGFGRWTLTDDAALLDVVTSANVACGFHAGDAVTMRRVATLAAERGVAIGAHVGYRDLAGFGRRAMAVPADELTADVLYQLGALEACCRAAAAVVAGVSAFAPLPVLGLPGSALLRAAVAGGLAAVAEGFADRAYAADGTLVPRGAPGAVIADPEVVAERSVALARGELAGAAVRSVCVHGDSPGAVTAARRARAALEAAGVAVEAFA
jgi:UPF0271 protein